SRWDVK
nr:Chain B, Hsh155 [Saccharomyces cerevisiae]